MKWAFIVLCELIKRVQLLSKFNVKIYSGVNKGFKWSPIVGDNDYAIGTYDLATSSLLEKFLVEGNIVYDIGANTGYFTLASARLVGDTGKVFSFEPLPANISMLQKHVSINKINNTVIMKMAVSNRQGKVNFSNEENNLGNTYVDSIYFKDNRNKIEVDTASIDYLVNSLIITPPDLIKIDAEGAEYEILRGADKIISKYRPVLLLATHDNHTKGIKDKCYRFLKEKQYEIKSIGINNINPLMEDFLAIPK